MAMARKIILLLLFAAVLCLAAFLSYGPSLDGAFVMDDLPDIIENESIRITSLSPAHLWGSTQVAPKLAQRRPLAYLSFAVNYYYSGFNSRSFRTVNVIILVASGLALLAFTYLLMERWIDKNAALWVAVGCAALWTLHPLQTNMTSYIVQRMTSLAILNYFLACVFFLLWARGGRAWLWIPCLAFGALAALAKEVGYILPLSFLIMWLVTRREFTEKWASKRAFLLGGPLLVLCALVAAAFLFRDGYSLKEFTLSERVLTEPRVLAWYLLLFFFPSPGLLNLDMDVPLSTGLLSPPTTILSLLFHLSVIALAVRNWGRWRAVSSLVILYYAHHLIESSVLPLEIAFEHRMCLPGAFLAMLVSLLAYRLAGAARLGEPTRHRAAVALILIISVGMGVLTHERNLIWASPKALFMDVVAKSPGNARGHLNLARHYFLEGDIANAEKHNASALAAKPNYAEALIGMGLVRRTQGRHSEALDFIMQAEKTGYRHEDLYYNKGVMLAQLGNRNGAFKAFREAISLNPGIRDARYNMGLMYWQMGDRNQALSWFREELRVNPGSNLARSMLRTMGAPQR